MAIGGFATKRAIEVETQFAKVSTLLDSSQVDFQKYKNEIAKLQQIWVCPLKNILNQFIQLYQIS